MSRSAICASLLVASILMMACAAESQPPVVASTPATAKVPTIDQSLEMYGVGSPKISPDGKRVVYEQTRTNWDANAFETDLWIADVATGERRQLTTAGHSCNSAEWSPDGKWIAFASDRPGSLPKSPGDKTTVVGHACKWRRGATTDEDGEGRRRVRVGAGLAGGLRFRRKLRSRSR